MDFKEIKQIIELMTKNSLSSFHLERDGNTLELKKGVDVDAVAEMISKLHATLPQQQVTYQMPSGMHTAAPAAAAPGHAAAAPGPLVGSNPPAAGGAGEEPSGPTINSPMVGTFYRAPGPNDPIFVKEGDRVTEDTTVCIIEAMKVMNEIKAETKGTIVRVLVDDATPVQYGEPLFEIKP